MIDPRDPDFAEKRAEELLNQAINRVAAECDLPVVVLHRVLIGKAHELMIATLKLDEDDDVA